MCLPVAHLTRAYATLFTLWSLSPCLSQWQAAGVPFRITEMANIYTDTVGDAIYFCGESSLNNDFDMGDGAIPFYTNGQWDTLGVFHGRPQTIVRWHDTLVVAGYFNNVNSVPFPGIVAYVDGEWLPFGEVDDVYRLKVIDDGLYAIGAISSADGIPCQGIARRVGGNWQPVGTMDAFASTSVQDVAAWNGTLVMTGVFGFNGSAFGDIAILDNGVWHPLGTGIMGGFSAGRSLAVYEDELYISGSIDINAGNAGHGIMRWDGTAFHPVGTGLQGAPNDFSILCGAIDLKVHDGLLWASGTFQNAGHVPAPGIATWDGTEWCGLPLGPQPECNGFDFLHDTLFAGCFLTLNGENVNCAVRFTGSNYADTCSATVGMNESVGHSTATLRVYPNPTTDLLTMHYPAQRSGTIAITDALGRTVWRTPWRNQPLDVRQLSTGVYQLTLRDVHDKPVAAGRFVKE